jgi:hypothetical protein
MAADVPPPGVEEAPWPAPTDDYQLLELELEWSGLDDGQARIAAAMRPFVITRDPLAWIPKRGSAWATANADGDTLEVPVYVLREEVARRLADADGDLGAALLPFVEPVVLTGAACQGLLITGVHAELAFRGETPRLFVGPAAAPSLAPPAARLRSPHWEPAGLGAVQDLVQEAFGPVALDRSAVRLAPTQTAVEGCRACTGASFGFPGDLDTAMRTMCPPHLGEARAVTRDRVEHAQRSNPAGWRAVAKASARTTGLPDPADAPMPERHGGEVGRNDPCPCGSGRKYKRCHGR